MKQCSCALCIGCSSVEISRIHYFWNDLCKIFFTKTEKEFQILHSHTRSFWPTSLLSLMTGLIVMTLAIFSLRITN